MPKMKTKSSAKKRFKITGKGKVKSKSAFTRHMQMNKSRKMKRKAKGMHMLDTTEAVRILRNFLPYGRKNRKKTVAQNNAAAQNKGDA